MKAQAILVGVNVAASIPLVLSQQAMAQGDDTASFLKSVVAQKAVAESLQSQTPKLVLSQHRLPSARDLSVQSLSTPKAVQSRIAMSSGAVKLRPFVAGRKLPSRRDLGGALSAQVPQMDTVAPTGSLTGNVSETGYSAQSDSYNAPGYGGYHMSAMPPGTRSRLREAAAVVARFEKKVLPRAVAGHMPATPGQVGFPCARQAVASFKPVARPTGPSPDQWAQLAKQAGQNEENRQFNEDQELEAMGRQLKGENGPMDMPADMSMSQNMPQNMPLDLSADMEAPAGTAGPPPFPLSLLPEASLKQFIGGTVRGNRMQAQAKPTPSYFGSWHAGQQAPAAHHNLQPAGFHTFLTSHNSQRSAAFKQYSPVAYRNAKRVAPMKTTVRLKGVSSARIAAKPAQMAVYGSYPGTTGL